MEPHSLGQRRRAVGGRVRAEDLPPGRAPPARADVHGIEAVPLGAQGHEPRPAAGREAGQPVRDPLRGVDAPAPGSVGSDGTGCVRKAKNCAGDSRADRIQRQAGHHDVVRDAPQSLDASATHSRIRYGGAPYRMSLPTSVTSARVGSGGRSASALQRPRVEDARQRPREHPALHPVRAAEAEGGHDLHVRPACARAPRTTRVGRPRVRLLAPSATMRAGAAALGARGQAASSMPSSGAGSRDRP